MSDVDRIADGMRQVRAMPIDRLQTLIASVANLTVNGEFSADTQQDLVLLLRDAGIDPALFMEPEPSAEGLDAQYPATLCLSVPTRMQAIVRGTIDGHGVFRVSSWQMDSGSYHVPSSTELAHVVAEARDLFADTDPAMENADMYGAVRVCEVIIEPPAGAPEQAPAKGIRCGRCG